MKPAGISGCSRPCSERCPACPRPSGLEPFRDDQRFQRNHSPAPSPRHSSVRPEFPKPETKPSHKRTSPSTHRPKSSSQKRVGATRHGLNVSAPNSTTDPPLSCCQCLKRHNCSPSFRDNLGEFGPNQVLSPQMHEDLWVDTGGTQQASPQRAGDAG